MRTKWEYTIRHPFNYICTHPPKGSKQTHKGNIESYFNQMGDMGWEFCGHDKYGYYFKRHVFEDD